MKKKDEVERLLEAAQDEIMLKLSIDSHISRVSPDYLSSDLHNRFLALRSGPSLAPPPPPPPPKQQPRSNGAQDSDDQLFARFAALKASLPPAAAAAAAASSSPSTPHVGPTALVASQSTPSVADGEEDEVEKVIQWAIDAARLDPSPPSDDDDHDADDHDDPSSDDEDGDGDGDPRKDGNHSRGHG